MWKSRTPQDAVGLASQLSEINWTWQLAEIPQLVEQFGWTMIATNSTGAMFDTGFGLASGKAFAHEGQVQRLQVSLSTIGPDTDDTRAQVRSAYSDMADALVAALGTPSSANKGELEELRWAGPESTLLLQELTRSITLVLATNDWLAGFDRSVEHSRQGLI
ncbi:DUF6301 family protein [Nocardia neocaledoniensis]|uniref:DUF6301 family protein n=1 Tax=Nocardia neocaledoniensis TaxID=236511 RepID=UPI002458000C|nr:DUF6301 family protein [Nocardia neocaledoniensis]